jgi:four helix bundle protein
MPTMKQFEDLKVWQDSRQFVKTIYLLSDKKTFRDFSLRDQIRRSSLSVMSNIAEGFERISDNEHMQFLNYAKSSAAEVRSQLYTTIDLNYIDQATFDTLYQEVVSISRQLAGFMRYLNASKKSQPKVKR